jgi:hypothetical protein
MKIFFTYREIRLPLYYLTPDAALELSFGTMTFTYELAIGNGLQYNGRLLGSITASDRDTILEVINGLRLFDAKIVGSVADAQALIRQWSGNDSITLSGDDDTATEKKESASANIPNHIYGTITVSEAETWIDNNVTDLDSAKVALKHMIGMIIMIRDYILAQT